MKSKSEILKDMTKALCPEAKYRMLRLEIEVDKRDMLFNIWSEVHCIYGVLLNLKEEQSCDKETK